MNFKEKIYNNGKIKMNYGIYFPDNYKKLPLIVYLHGAGERGENFTHLERHAIPRLLKEGKEYEAVILTPQCPAQFVWDNVVTNVKEIIDSVVLEYGIEKDRISITGSSMGGFGTWMMGVTYNNFFAGIAPVAGGSMSWRMQNLKTTPVYALHGDKDTLVPPIYSELCVNAVNANGGNAKLELLLNLGHNDGINFAYEHTDIIDWLLMQRRTDFDEVAEFCSHLF
ncbi:MAG: hypothetical protein E7568_02820 [Ruminococcaceae bacterium]|nr:hypothetical protein [Oscillospiraceae bacterium]